MIEPTVKDYLLKMKFIISLILLMNIFNNKLILADVDRASPEIIRQLIDILSNVVKTRDVELPFPLPIEDIYEFDQAQLNLPGDIFSVNVNISKGSLSGVSSFRLLELNLSDTQPTVGLNILFPLLKLHADNYNLDGNIYEAVPIKGNGVAHIEIYNLQFSGTFYMKQSPVSHAVLLDKLENAEFHVERILSSTEFDHNIDEIISAMVEDLLADYINRFNKYLIATYSDTAIQFINQIIEAP